MLFLGCDSGATKAAFAIADDSGHVLAHRVFPGVDLFICGVERYRSAMQEYLRATLDAAGVQPQDIACAAFGLTGYGESRTAVADMERALCGVLGDVPLILRNDAVMGWSGAMRCRSGICIASGTGSVAYGENEQHIGARAGGWSVRFGDEGSCYWVAAQAIRAFFHQADGRREKTLLYDEFMHRFDLEDPLHFGGEITEYTLDGDYARVAALQRVVLDLCRRGDPEAARIYKEAAAELAALVRALKRQIGFAEDAPVRVSYTGGLFHAGECILSPLREYIGEMGCVLVEPAFGPLAGAVGYAARASLSEDKLERVMQAVDESQPG